MNLYEKVKRHCKHTTRRLNQHGQALAFYAIAFPILFMFVCVGFDMGWYYLNVSRLQNAAEAATIAGANTLADYDDSKSDKTIKNVKKVLLVNEYSGTETNETTLDDANASAAEYADKNLDDTAESADVGDIETPAAANSITNSWTDEPVTPAETLYKDSAENYYYRVTLSEEIKHFMMPGWFEPMKAEVTAVAKLSVNSGSDESSDKPDDNQVLDDEDVKKLEVLKNKNVIIGNWELQNGYRKANSTDKSKYAENLGYEMYAGAWNHFQDLHNHYDYDSNDKYNVFYRTETVNLSSDVDSNGNKVATTAVATAASINTVNKENYTYNPKNSADKGNPYEWQRLDSINVDFKQDVRMNDTTTAGLKYLKEDWDLPLGYPTGVEPLNRMYNGIESNSDSVLREKARSLRIHTTINIENPYPVRSYVKDSYYEEKDFKNRPDTEYPDVLWARIESEPMIYYKTYWTKNPINWSNREFNSVRQLIININQSNTAMETVSVEKDGQEVEETRYKYRPMIFFYDGPERYSITNPLRNSKPVIINFKEDFRGVFYMPNSPVVLLKDGKPITGNGNGVFQGFIVAYDYWELLDENDPESANYTKITENGIDMYVDSTGNVQYKYPDKYKKSYGTYDNFGRTDFTTHGYTVAAESAYNLFFSGVTLYGLIP